VKDVFNSVLGEKTTPSVLRPARVSPLMSLMSFRNVPESRKKVMVRDKNTPLTEMGAKKDQSVNVNEGKKTIKERISVI